MSKRRSSRRESLIDKFAEALADGISVVKWREENNVSERTAYRWSASAEVRKRVHQLRRDRCDGAVGVMAKHATAAAEEIVNLGKHAKSEAVKLSALCAVLSDMMTMFSLLRA